MNQLTRNWLYEHKRSSLSDLERKELNKRAFGIKKMLEEQDEQLEQTYHEEHKMGYCPKCYTLLPMSGHCDNCS